MISKTLMGQTLKSNIVSWCIVTALLAVSLAGIAGNGAPIAMTGSIFYGMVPGLIIAIYIILVGNKLLAAQVDRGTMAYILSTPVKRSKVAITQTRADVQLQRRLENRVIARDSRLGRWFGFIWVRRTKHETLGMTRFQGFLLWV